jgi:hypothetical protein
VFLVCHFDPMFMRVRGVYQIYKIYQARAPLQSAPLYVFFLQLSASCLTTARLSIPVTLADRHYQPIARIDGSWTQITLQITLTFPQLTLTFSTSFYNI